MQAAERATAKLLGENVDEAQRAPDRDAIDRWVGVEGVDLDTEA
jgi:hypothetical protein